MLDPFLPFVPVAALLIGAVVYALVGFGVARATGLRAAAGESATASFADSPPEPRPARLPLVARAGALLTFVIAVLNGVFASGLFGPSRLTGLIGTVVLTVAGTVILTRYRHARSALGTAVVVASVLLAARVLDYQHMAREARAGVARSDADRLRCCERDYRHCSTFFNNPCMRYGFDAFGYAGRADDAEWLALAAQATIAAGLVALGLVVLGKKRPGAVS